MLSLFFKCLFSALIIVLFSRSKNLLYCRFSSIISYICINCNVIVVQEQGTEALRKTALFGLWSLIPYAMYLLTVYLLATKMTAWGSLSIATVIWIITAAILVYIWQLTQ